MKQAQIITGQTATGKSGFALQKAKELGGDVISADSRQVYSTMDIITGKDVLGFSFTKVEDYKNFVIGYYLVDGIRIWGHDIVSPDVAFSAYNYTDVVWRILRNTIDSNQTPIVVGGSYFYIKALIYGLDEHVPPNLELRSSLEKLSVEELQEKLKLRSLETYESLNNSDKYNPRRLIRHIEKLETDTAIISKSFDTLPFEDITGFKFPSPKEAEEVISKRVYKRIDQGAFEEIEALVAKGYTSNDPGMQTIGYQEILSYMNGEMSKDEAIERWILSEKQYAKRQLTFMNSDPNIHWVERR